MEHKGFKNKFKGDLSFQKLILSSLAIWQDSNFVQRLLHLSISRSISQPRQILLIAPFPAPSILEAMNLRVVSPKAEARANY